MMLVRLVRGVYTMQYTNTQNAADKLMVSKIYEILCTPLSHKSFIVGKLSNKWTFHKSRRIAAVTVKDCI